MPNGKKERLRIGTRDSALARLQTDMALAALNAVAPEIQYEVVAVKTVGDKVLDRPLAEIGGRGVFVKELEESLLAHHVDLVVHSLKDLPTEMPDNLVLAATLKRDDPRDVLVCKAGTPFEKLAPHSRIATSSRRRSAQLQSLRADIVFVDIRGNIATRLRKHDEGQCDAMILAAAGLHRLQLHDRITHYFDPSTCTPAPGQGALGIECRGDDQFVIDLLKKIDDPLVSCAVTAERAFLNQLGGGCSVPVGALATLNNMGELLLDVCVASLDGKKVLRKQRTGGIDRAADLGATLATEMIGDGAGEILMQFGLPAPGTVSPP